MRFVDTIDIDAPVATVWAITLDVEGWPATTPTMTSVERLEDGPIAIGSTAAVKQPRQRKTVWKVSELQPERLFAWGTKVLGTSMVGRHELAANATGGTTNTLTLELDGPLAGLLGRLTGKQMKEAIATENRGFKQAAERITAEG